MVWGVLFESDRRAMKRQSHVAGTTENLSRPARPPLLVVDDDPLLVASLGFVLGERFDVHVATTREEAKRKAISLPTALGVALVDLGLPPDPHEPSEGFRLTSELLEMFPRMKILVLSGQSERANVQHALTLGAVDFIPKPCDTELLISRLEHQLLILDSEDTTAEPVGTDALIGSSNAMCTLTDEARRYANTPFPVLIEGESGTGKELVAALLHAASDRCAAPFLTVNCAALTPELLEAQLFGHAKGAFTGAPGAREGFFESAREGT